MEEDLTLDQEAMDYLAQFAVATKDHRLARRLQHDLAAMATSELPRTRLWDDALMLLMVTTPDKVIPTLKWRHKLA